MFHNTPQNSDFVEVFDTKSSNDKNKAFYRSSSNPEPLKMYDQQLKSFILSSRGSSTHKVVFPKQDSTGLFLIQQYLVFMIQPQQNFSIQLYVSDTNKTQRRINISPSCQKSQSKLFFVRIPSGNLNFGWYYICIDMWSFMSAFSNQTYRALQQIHLGGSFKLRKIITTKYCIGHIQQQISVNLPKQFQFNTQLNYQVKLYEYSQYFSQISTILSEKQETIINRSSVRQNSNKKNIFSTPINNALKKTSSIKNRSFVNNSDGMAHKKTLLPKIEKSSNKSTALSKISTSQIDPKQFFSRPMLQRRFTNSSSKTPVINSGSTLISIQSKIGKRKNIKNIEKVVINQWRSNNINMQPQSTASQSRSLINKSTISSVLNKRKQKIVNLTNHPYMPEKSVYSDSQYLEISQRFSTITDQKFFRKQSQNQRTQKQKRFVQKQQEQSMTQQIQQAIEVETNINAQELQQRKQSQKIQQCIRHQINQRQQTVQNIVDDQGFAELHCQQFLNKVQRPYSPPLSNQKQKKYEQTVKQIIPSNNTEIQVVYDPILKCYYDFKTQTYYQLKS